MDQLGNTERITEDVGSESADHRRPDGLSDALRSVCTSAVFRARLGCVGVDDGDGSFPDGFSGTLALQNLESLDEESVGETLGRVAHLIAWAQAQQARLMNRMEEIFREGFFLPGDPGQAGRRVDVDQGMAFSLAASESAAILNVPPVTGQRLLFEADRLCGPHSATLDALEDGRFSYAHAQVVVEQCLPLPAGQLPGFEAGLLEAAKGQTRAQFACRARRLREKKYPETIPERHRSAFDKRRVTLDREEDGMSCLSAYLRAAEAQQIYAALSTSARGERDDGDPRTTDQLRADILAQLLMGGLGAPREGNSGMGNSAGGSARSGGGGRVDGGKGVGAMGRRERESGSAGDGEGTADAAPGTADPAPGTSGMVPRAEIMVLINAETLFGADDQPAELHGYGPISADEARRLARNALHWTGLAQDPRTGEILGVGRRRKVPAGLARWLRARDGTCRFPGCRVSTANTEIDHTTDWAHGGPTDHGNLAHLCRRHHRFKTLGLWKAAQPTPGVIEWTSPTGRVYRTEPFLELAPQPAPVSTEPPPF